MHARENSILMPWTSLLIWAVIAMSVSLAQAEDSETVASLKQRNLRLEAELKAASAKIEQLTGEINRLDRKLKAIRSQLDEEPIPADIDAPCYNDLRQLLLQIRDKRTTKSSDFADVSDRASEISKKYLNDLKSQASRDYPIKQQLLWAIRDDLPRLMKGNLSMKSMQETEFSNRLDEIEKLLSKLSEK